MDAQASNPWASENIQLALRVSHVCHFWHETSIRCSRLWAYLHFPAPEGLISELLRRCKCAPLVVEIRYLHDTTSQQFTKFLEQRLPHIEELLVNTPANMMKCAVNALEGPAPRLRRLVLQAADAREAPVKVGDLPKTIRCKETRSLELFELISWPIWSNHPMKRGPFLPMTLKQLCIVCNKRSIQQNLIKVIGELPLLTNIELVHRLDANSIFEPNPIKSARVIPPPEVPPIMHHLVQLRLIAEPVWSANILNHFHFPELSSLDIFCHDNIRKMRVLEAALRPKLYSLGRMDTACVWGFDHDVVFMELQRTENEMGHLALSYSQRRKNGVAWKPTSLWNTILTLPIASGISTMHITGKAPGLWQAMYHLSAECFPSLRRLVLEKVKMLETTPWVPLTLTATLVGALSLRAHECKRLATIHMDHCYYVQDASCISQLQNFTDWVYWVNVDGTEEECTPLPVLPWVMAIDLETLEQIMRVARNDARD